MEEQQQKPPKPVSLVVGLLMIIVALFIDLIDLLILLLDFVIIGLFLSVLSGVLKFILFRMWFWFLGVKGILPLAVQIIGGLIEAIPAIGALPVTTLTVSIVIIIANSEIGQKVTAVTSLKKGKPTTA